MSIVVREAVAADARMVTEIYVVSPTAAWSPYERHGVREVTDERIARWEADLQRPRHHWWVAELMTHPAGVAGTGPSWGPMGAALGELDTIAVLPCYWRRGVGRALMAVVNHQLDDDGYAEAVLWTWSGYASAYALYAACGWQVTNQIRDEGRQVAFSRLRFGARVARVDRRGVNGVLGRFGSPGSGCGPCPLIEVASSC
jgi:GNAT superfamily N-acetyltransferase